MKLLSGLWSTGIRKTALLIITAAFSVAFDARAADVPYAGYPYGTMGLSPGANMMLSDEYNFWKDNYVTSGGCAVGRRVKRDEGNGRSPYDTVSEGQAYGMILAVYFNDQALYDDLLAYAKYHASPTTGFMHWFIRSDGIRISEFYQPIPHSAAYYKFHYGNHGTTMDGGQEQPNYFFRSNDSGEQDPPDGGSSKPGGYGYVQASIYGRDYSNATDADLDMAASLIFAYKRWGTASYKTDAISFIKKTCKYNVELFEDASGTKKFFLKAGASWGGTKGWNPSYYMPSHFRLFHSFMTADSNAGSFAGPAITPVNCSVSATYHAIVDGIIETMDGEMAKIDAVNGSAGMFPDWIDTYANSSSESSSPHKAAGNSDRRYYTTRYNGYVDAVEQAAGQGLDLQSMNCYYDAVRVPWRLAMDYSWYGTESSRRMAEKIGNYFKDRLTSFVDGYSINGDPWSWDDRDGFNFAQVPATRPQGATPSTTFLGMFTSAIMHVDTGQRIDGWYGAILGQRDVIDPDAAGYSGYHYYGNTLRLMSLLYASGYMVNLYSTTWYDPTQAPANNARLRIRSRQSDKSSHYINISDLAAGNLVQTSEIEFSWSDSKWRAKTSVEDGKTYYNFYSFEKSPANKYRFLYIDTSNDEKVRFLELDSNVATNDIGLDFELKYSGTANGWSIKSRRNGKYVTISTLTQSGVRGNILKCETHAPGPSTKHYWFLEPNSK